MEEAALDGFLKPYYQRLQGCDDDDEVNESEEFDGKHYFVESYGFTGVSGSCVIPSLMRSALHLIPGGICPGYFSPLSFL